MTAAAIIGLISSVLGIVWYLVRRKFERPPTPLEDQHEAVSQEIIQDDAVGANRRVDDLLRKIQGDKQRSGDSAR